MASYPFYEIELEHECDPETQLGNSIPLPDSIMTPVSSPDFNHFPDSIFDTVPIHREIELPIFYDSHLELDQYITSESHIDKLARSPFKEIEPRQECDFDPQICDLV